MKPRVLRRPIGGWGARQWRREVRAWLLAACLYLSAGGTCQALLGLFGVIFGY